MKTSLCFTLLLTFSFALTAQSTPIDSVDIEDHKIELLSMNEFDGEFYVWTYKLTSGTAPAISHWILDLCLDYLDHVTDGVSTTDHTQDPDPSTGFFGLKFNQGFDDGEMKTVMLYLTKSVVAVETFVGIKDGSGEYSGTILAPSCECEEVPEPSTLALVGAGILGLTARRRRLL